MTEATLLKKTKAAYTKHKVVSAKVFARYKNGSWKMKPGKLRDRYLVNEQRTWKVFDNLLEKYMGMVQPKEL